jgi:hypothetical protein
MEAKKGFKLFNEILKENGTYSQGRVYLLVSVVAYYVTLGILTFAGIRKDELNMENFRIIVDALQYAMALFGGYVFGGKFINALSVYRAGKIEIQTSEKDKSKSTNIKTKKDPEEDLV